MSARLPSRSRGAAAVEFALVVVVFLLLVFGIIELGRALWTWNSAVDSVRRGARSAAIAAIGDRATVIADMQLVFPDLDPAKVVIEYSASGRFDGTPCNAGTCRFVRVGIRGYTFSPVIFFLPDSIAMPQFATTYPVEALGAT